MVVYGKVWLQGVFVGDRPRVPPADVVVANPIGWKFHPDWLQPQGHQMHLLQLWLPTCPAGITDSSAMWSG